MAKKRPDRRPSRDEIALFRRAMADAEPLMRRPATGREAGGKDNGREAEENGNGREAEENDAQGSPPAARRSPPADPAAPAAPPPDRRAGAVPLEAGIAAGLDRRTMDRLRKGRLRPEARIDLHGMTAAAAHGALAGFLASAEASGRRCVLVITGKGALKEGGGVLRREFPAWLNAPPNRARVLGFTQAQPADGGTGAFYVLLRRRRD